MSRLSTQRGASAVEFVLCLPMALFMVIGALDFAMWALTRQAVSRAVQDGARQASVMTLDDSETATDLENAAEAATKDALATWGLANPGIAIDADWVPDADGVWWLTVAATVPYTSMFGTLDQTYGRPVTRRFLVYTQEQP